jgi:hypothetical protein
MDPDLFYLGLARQVVGLWIVVYPTSPTNEVLREVLREPLYLPI